MRLYFFANNSSAERLNQRLQKIINQLNDAGFLVLSNLQQKNVAEFTDQDLEKFAQAGEILIDKVEALIIEGSSYSSDGAYLIALAIAHKKPILYLSEKNRPIDKSLQNLRQDKEAAQYLILATYTDDNLNSVIMDFIGDLEKGGRKEKPTIKFTLRITSRIERYLQWQTLNTKLTKADFLREQIEKMIDGDEKFKKFSQK